MEGANGDGTGAQEAAGCSAVHGYDDGGPDSAIKDAVIWFYKSYFDKGEDAPRPKTTVSGYVVRWEGMLKMLRWNTGCGVGGGEVRGRRTWSSAVTAAPGMNIGIENRGISETAD